MPHWSSEPDMLEGLVARVEQTARPLRDETDLDPLMQSIGDARYVLLGEASHGTSDYYTWRAAITRRLIAEKGFQFIGVEGDWPDCMRINRYVRSLPGVAGDWREVLMEFGRWPTWMWANVEVGDFIEWLQEHNWQLAERDRVGFYGLDLYSLYDSLHAVLAYVEENLPEALPMAREAARCFAPFDEDAQEYARNTMLVPESCEEEVVRLLTNLRQHPKATQGFEDHEARFDAEMNALVAKNAENYYRTMVRASGTSWNVRDRHMVEALERISDHRGPNAKCIVWEHNTHVGDARATDMASQGMVNVGQLVREAHPNDTFLCGFGSYRGTVIAGRYWDAPMERMQVPSAREGSWEDIMHRAGPEDKLLLLDDLHGDDIALKKRGHRAIGVVYNPKHDSWGNFVPTILPKRYDAFLYIDQTRALRPLHAPTKWTEADETYPFGL